MGSAEAVVVNEVVSEIAADPVGTLEVATDTTCACVVGKFAATTVVVVLAAPATRVEVVITAAEVWTGVVVARPWPVKDGAT